jgi:hypothetical protein
MEARKAREEENCFACGASAGGLGSLFHAVTAYPAEPAFAILATSMAATSGETNIEQSTFNFER